MLIPIIHKPLQKAQEEQMIPNSCAASIPLILITKKKTQQENNPKNYRPTFLVNTDMKILNKTLAKYNLNAHQLMSGWTKYGIIILWTVGSVLKNPPANAGDTGWISGLGRSPGGDPGAIHSSILVWKISWIEEPGGLQSTGSQRVGHHHAWTIPSH